MTSPKLLAGHKRSPRAGPRTTRNSPAKKVRSILFRSPDGSVRNKLCGITEEEVNCAVQSICLGDEHKHLDESFTEQDTPTVDEATLFGPDVSISSDSSTQHLNDSSSQQLNDSSTQKLNDSSPQKLNDSSPQKLNDAPTQQLNDAPTQQLNDAPTQKLNDAPTQQLNNVSSQQLNGSVASSKPLVLIVKNVPPGTVTDSHFTLRLPNTTDASPPSVMSIANPPIATRSPHTRLAGGWDRITGAGLIFGDAESPLKDETLPIRTSSSPIASADAVVSPVAVQSYNSSLCPVVVLNRSSVDSGPTKVIPTTSTTSDDGPSKVVPSISTAAEAPNKSTPVKLISNSSIFDDSPAKVIPGISTADDSPAKALNNSSPAKASSKTGSPSKAANKSTPVKKVLVSNEPSWDSKLRALYASPGPGYEDKSPVKSPVKSPIKSPVKSPVKSLVNKSSNKTNSSVAPSRSGKKAETKSGKKAETKSGKKAETKSGKKAETKSGNKAETKSGKKAETKAETKAEKKAETKVDVTPAKAEETTQQVVAKTRKRRETTKSVKYVEEDTEQSDDYTEESDDDTEQSDEEEEDSSTTEDDNECPSVVRKRNVSKRLREPEAGSTKASPRKRVSRLAQAQLASSTAAAAVEPKVVQSPTKLRGMKRNLVPDSELADATINVSLCKQLSFSNDQPPPSAVKNSISIQVPTITKHTIFKTPMKLDEMLTPANALLDTPYSKLIRLNALDPIPTPVSAIPATPCEAPHTPHVSASNAPATPLSCNTDRSDGSSYYKPDLASDAVRNLGDLDGVSDGVEHQVQETRRPKRTPIKDVASILGSTQEELINAALNAAKLEILYEREGESEREEDFEREERGETKRKENCKESETEATKKASKDADVSEDLGDEDSDTSSTSSTSSDSDSSDSDSESSSSEDLSPSAKRAADLATPGKSNSPRTKTVVALPRKYVSPRKVSSQEPGEDVKKTLGKAKAKTPKKATSQSAMARKPQSNSPSKSPSSPKHTLPGKPAKLRQCTAVMDTFVGTSLEEKRLRMMAALKTPANRSSAGGKTNQRSAAAHPMAKSGVPASDTVEEPASLKRNDKKAASASDTVVEPASLKRNAKKAAPASDTVVEPASLKRNVKKAASASLKRNIKKGASASDNVVEPAFLKRNVKRGASAAETVQEPKHKEATRKTPEEPVYLKRNLKEYSEVLSPRKVFSPKKSLSTIANELFVQKSRLTFRDSPGYQDEANVTTEDESGLVIDLSACDRTASEVKGHTELDSEPTAKRHTELDSGKNSSYGPSRENKQQAECAVAKEKSREVEVRESRASAMETQRPPRTEVVPFNFSNLFKSKHVEPAAEKPAPLRYAGGQEVHKADNEDSSSSWPGSIQSDLQLRLSSGDDDGRSSATPRSLHRGSLAVPEQLKRSYENLLDASLAGVRSSTPLELGSEVPVVRKNLQNEGTLFMHIVYQGEGPTVAHKAERCADLDTFQFTAIVEEEDGEEKELTNAVTAFQVLFSINVAGEEDTRNQGMRQQVEDRKKMEDTRETDLKRQREADKHEASAFKLAKSPLADRDRGPRRENRDHSRDKSSRQSGSDSGRTRPSNEERRRERSGDRRKKEHHRSRRRKSGDRTYEEKRFPRQQSPRKPVRKTRPTSEGFVDVSGRSSSKYPGSPLDNLYASTKDRERRSAKRDEGESGRMFSDSRLDSLYGKLLDRSLSRQAGREEERTRSRHGKDDDDEKTTDRRRVKGDRKTKRDKLVEIKVPSGVAKDSSTASRASSTTSKVSSSTSKTSSSASKASSSAVKDSSSSVKASSNASNASSSTSQVSSSAVKDSSSAVKDSCRSAKASSCIQSASKDLSSVVKSLSTSARLPSNAGLSSCGVLKPAAAGTDLSSALKVAVGATEDSRLPGDDLMTYAIVGSPRGEAGRKRKASPEHTQPATEEKKARLPDPRVLLKTLDVDRFLSRIHGPDEGPVIRRPVEGSVIRGPDEGSVIRGPDEGSVIRGPDEGEGDS